MKSAGIILRSVSEKYALILLSLIYVFICSYLLDKYGVKIVNDSPRYINYAQNLKQGFYFDPLNFWYLSYAIFVLIHQVIIDSLLTIIISQYVVGYLAVIALFHAIKALTNNPTTSFLACILFVLFPDNLFWHSYILTESIYSSFLCFSFYALVNYRKRKTKKGLLLLLVTLLICFFCKPTSPALLIALMIPSIIVFLKNPNYRLLKMSGCIIGLIALLILANQMITMHRVMLIYEKGDIIFAMHQTPESQYRDLMMINPPADLIIPSEKGALIYEMSSFIISNPLYWLKLFSSKLMVYLSHIRPYWSWPHNLYSIILVWPCYFLSAYAIRKKLVSPSMTKIIVSYVVIHTLIISNTWVDWDARFFTPLYPVIAFLSAVALYEKICSPKKAC